MAGSAYWPRITETFETSRQISMEIAQNEKGTFWCLFYYIDLGICAEPLQANAAIISVQNYTDPVA